MFCPFDNYIIHRLFGFVKYIVNNVNFYNFVDKRLFYVLKCDKITMKARKIK